MAYRNLDAANFRAEALKAGLPEMVAKILSDTDAGVAKGALFDDGGQLARLIGRPTTPFRATITGFLQNQHAAEHAPSHG
jgi:NAD(P)H dehydrogenase (quinone)